MPGNKNILGDKCSGKGGQPWQVVLFTPRMWNKDIYQFNKQQGE